MWLGSPFTRTIQRAGWEQKEGAGALASVARRMELPLSETGKTVGEAGVAEEHQGLSF